MSISRISKRLLAGIGAPRTVCNLPGGTRWRTNEDISYRVGEGSDSSQKTNDAPLRAVLSGPTERQVAHAPLAEQRFKSASGQGTQRYSVQMTLNNSAMTSPGDASPVIW